MMLFFQINKLHTEEDSSLENHDHNHNHNGTLLVYGWLNMGSPL